MLAEGGVRVHHKVLLGLRGGQIGQGSLGELVEVVAGIAANCQGDGRGRNGGCG